MANLENSILFVDTASPYEYDCESLNERPMGGTEATVLRVSKELANQTKVVVAQAARTKSVFSAGVEFIPFTWKDFENLPKARSVVVLRSHKVLPRLRQAMPRADFLLWMHCLPGKRHKKSFPQICAHSKAKIICVSNNHREMLLNYIEKYDMQAARTLSVHVAYNPLSPAVERVKRNINPNKLLFVSSPHKGLEQVLGHFKFLKERIPELELHVANPGYMPFKLKDLPAGVKFLGSLKHEEALAHLGESLCLFYPQSSFVETFGLVLAEANAVGTPALAHDLGAAREVLFNPNAQLVDANSHTEVLDKILEWRKTGPPKTRMNHKFSMNSILKTWSGLLFGFPANAKQERRRKHRTRMFA